MVCTHLKSGYKALCGPNPISNTSMVSSCWDKIWKLGIPGKIKHFMWRACSKLLRTMQALHLKRIVEKSEWPVCKETTENTLHALHQCRSLGRLWACLAIAVPQTEHSNFADWWKEICDAQGKDCIQQVAIICLEIWNRRNYCVWSNRSNTDQLIQSSLTQIMMQWQQPQIDQDARKESSSISSLKKWVLPSSGYLKCNIDAALFPENF